MLDRRGYLSSNLFACRAVARPHIELELKCVHTAVPTTIFLQSVKMQI